MPVFGKSNIAAERTLHVGIELVDLRSQGEPETIAFMGTDVTVAKILPRDEALGVRVKVSPVGIQHVKSVAIGLPLQPSMRPMAPNGGVLSAQGVVNAPPPEDLGKRQRGKPYEVEYPCAQWEWHQLQCSLIDGTWSIVVPTTVWDVGSNNMPICVRGKFNEREWKWLWGFGPSWRANGEVFFHVALNVQRLGGDGLAQLNADKFFLTYLQGRGWISAVAAPMGPSFLMTGQGGIVPPKQE